ncbi:MAG: amino acid ABC transporter substrate-binding protein [Microcystaceae cyanobacterium]
MMIHSLIKFSLSCTLCMASASATLATPVLEEIAETGLLKVAVREDAVPFGYRNSRNQISGICLSLIDTIKQEIKDTLGQEIISVRVYKSSLINRFDLVEDSIVHFECGPNTIRTFKQERNIEFSNPFFVTGTQLLVKTENLSNVNLNSSLRDVRIGALRRTTNRRLIRNRFPDAQIENFVGITGRKRGIQALQDGRIDAFASDGILLIGEAVLLGLVLERDYVLVPPNPLKCDYYGLILPNNDPNWKALIDRSIETAREQRIFREWLGVILPELEDSLEYCLQSQNSEEEEDMDEELESLIQEESE